MSEEEEKVCVVCTDAYTKQVRKSIRCPYCKKGACSNCQKAYLMSSVHDAHCMFCKVAWNDDFIRDTFTNNWLTKEYSKTEQECLWQREKSLLPASMLNVERRKLQTEFQGFTRVHMKQSLGQLYETVHNLYTELSSGNADLGHVLQFMKRLTKLQSSTKLELDPETFPPDRLQELFGQDRVTREKVKVANTFNKPCPAPDCRGFLSTQYKCGLCETKVCPTCFVITRLQNAKDSPEHTCKPEDIATAEMIRKETKNCPKCGASISKIEGCDQMFCTSCNTPFSWRTLEIINGRIHNPHYFQWLNRQRPNGEQAVPAAQVGCRDGMPDTWTVSATLRRYFGNSVEYITDFMRHVLHIHGTQRQMLGNETNLNGDIRESYLEGKITEERFKQLSHQRWKARKFTQLKNEVIEVLMLAATSIIQDFMNNHSSMNLREMGQMRLGIFQRFPDENMQAFTNLKASIEEICDYYSKNMIELHERYKKDCQFDVIRPHGESLRRHTTTRKTK